MVPAHIAANPVATKEAYVNKQIEPALFQSFQEEHRSADDAMRAEARRLGGRSVDIREAGCGQRWFANLDHAVCGDLFSVQIEPESINIVYNAFVLEHVERPFDLLVRFHAWQSTSGLLILTIPGRSSAEGFVTAYFPLWVHVVYYRYCRGNPNAGKPWHITYPTPFKSIVSRPDIHEACSEIGFEVVAEMGHDSGVEGTSALYHGTLRLRSFVSGGNLRSDHSDLSFPLRKGA